MIKNTFLFFFILSFQIFFTQNREANDCVNYIQICGNQTISLNPIGYGIQEINYNNVCRGQENNSIWLKFTAKTSGTLGFDLIPSNPDINVDYDFWVFGPNATCNNLGSAIRCSTTNPEAAQLSNNETGMRDSEPAGDFFEGPGEFGDGYVKSLDVKAGESYFLVIDRPIGNGSFSLNWTGTAILEDPFGAAPHPFGTVADIKVCNTSLLYDLYLFTPQILNGNQNFGVTYYKTYEDATYDENGITQPITLDNHDYYYRIQSKSSECFRVEKIRVNWQPLVLERASIKSCNLGHNKGIFDLTSAKFTNEILSSVSFYPTLQDAINHISGTEILDPANYSSGKGSVFAWVVTNNGCANAAEVVLDFYPVPNIDASRYNANLCDDDLDNSVSLKFSDITPIIVDDASDFDVIYYLASNTASPLGDDFTFTQDTPIIVEVKSKNGCASAFGSINFRIAPKITLKNPLPQEICDSDLSGQETINLSDYSTYFTSDIVSVKFYETMADAKKKINAIASSQVFNNSRSYFFRFENNNACPAIGELQLIFKRPKTSSRLQDITICKDDEIVLDAGGGFDAYLWDSGSTDSNSGSVKVGEHWVDLTSDGCTTRQFVKVMAEEQVVIKVLEIENNKLTITATGGSTPYEYSLDGISWQSSHIFENIPKGFQKVFVRSAKKCSPSMREFSNINLVNVITPNGDGKNDFLDYSELRLKNNVSFKVFDRYGKMVFAGKENNYIWDGKSNNRALPSGSYWCLLEWTEPDTAIVHKNNTWIFLKNN